MECSRPHYKHLCGKEAHPPLQRPSYLEEKRPRSEFRDRRKSSSRICRSKIIELWRSHDFNLISRHLERVRDHRDFSLFLRHIEIERTGIYRVLPIGVILVSATTLKAGKKFIVDPNNGCKRLLLVPS